MAYTRPSASTADASWLGAAAYTRPAAPVADASFLADYSATSFSSTQFGVPIGAKVAAGFSTGSFGTPSSRRRMAAYGTRQTVVSIPGIPFLAAVIAPANHFGTALAVQAQRPTSIHTTCFGIAAIPLRAQGFAPAVLPTPSVPLRAQGLAAATAFGTGIGFRAQRPAGFSATLFGSARVLPVAVGFQPVRFSIPSIPLRAGTMAPGIVFGLPAGTLYQRVTGFRSTAFGTPRNRPNAVGFRSTQFGTAAGHQFFRAAALAPVVRFSVVYRAFNQTQVASGSEHTHFGLPLALRYTTVAPGRLTGAHGFAPLLLGVPSARWRQQGTASASQLAAMGTPTASRGQRATGVAGAVFGLPFLRLRLTAASGHTTAYGRATASLVQLAASTYRPTAFGLPTTLRSHTYLAYGIDASRKFGQPKGFSRLNHPATGFTATHLGQPTCHERHRALHLAPVTHFGTPLLRRVAFCDQGGRAQGAGSATRFGLAACARGVRASSVGPVVRFGSFTSTQGP